MDLVGNFDELLPLAQKGDIDFLASIFRRLFLACQNHYFHILTSILVFIILLIVHLRHMVRNTRIVSPLAA